MQIPHPPPPPGGAALTFDDGVLEAYATQRHLMLLPLLQHYHEWC